MVPDLKEELSQLHLGDRRLDRRALVMAEDLYVRINEGHSAIARSWADAMAAYRFWANEQVDAEDLRAPHRSNTLIRANAQSTVRCVDDTTIFDFFGRPKTKGLGPITQDYQNAFLSHMMLAYGDDGLCLGVLEQKSWARTDGLGSRKEAHKKPIKEKESYRWLEHFRKVEALAKRAPETDWVYVADREADIYDLLYERDAAHLVIRSRFDRKTQSGEKMLHEVLSLSPLGRWEIPCPPRLKRPAGKVVFEARSKTLRLQAPWRPSRPEARRQFGDGCVLNVVVVEEVCPADVDPEEVLQWTLLTSLPVDTLEQVQAVVEHYRCRWEIEVFFRTLKSCCRYEDLQLKSFDKLQRALSLYTIVAWRITAFIKLSRTTPDMPASEAFSQEELVAIRSLSKNKKELKTVGDAVTQLACLGGYLNRKNDPPAGPKALVRGIKYIAAVVTLLEQGVMRCV